MFEDFMTQETLATFVGLVAATNVIVQFSKGPVKKRFGDGAIRVYAFIISTILTFAFIDMKGATIAQNILLTVVNSIIITLTALGSYETVADPKAEKRKRGA